MPAFESLFGCAAQATASAPGRANLLGEHTDYNQGLVLPVAIVRNTTVEVARSTDGFNRFHSVQLHSDVAYMPGDEARPGFARYLYGCIEVLRGRGHSVPAIYARVESDVPIGSGLSSSAALEVAMLRALRSLLQLSVDDVEIAQIAHQAENQYAGVNCGILDQMASSLATVGSMLYLDTRSLERRLLPMPPDTALLVIDSGASRSLAASGYNERRAECERAARMLELESLRDMKELAYPDQLPTTLYRRVRHVFSENARVWRAAQGVGAAALGELMNQSHASLSKDYEVSTPALDQLAATLQADHEVYGAKLTGAGFGGACVALVHAGKADVVAERVMSAFGAKHPKAAVLIAG